MELLPDYYLTNFERVVNYAVERHRHLFSSDELDTLGRFRSAPRHARLLFARLFLRRGPIFRLSRLSYAEIGPCDAAFRALADARLASEVDFGVEDHVVISLDTLTAAELRAIGATLGVSTSGKKADVVASVACHPRVRDALEETDVFISLVERQTFDLARVLFFGNRYQDLTEFVLVDLERLRYATYELSADPPLFPNRDDLDAYLAAAEASDADLSLLDHADLLRTARDAAIEFCNAGRAVPHRRGVDPARYRSRLALGAARELERRGLVAEASDIYELVASADNCEDARTDAVERLGVLAARGDAARFDAASARLLADERLDDIARYTVSRRRHILGLGESPDARLVQPECFDFELSPAGYAGQKALYRAASGEAVTVEEAVLREFGVDGLHAENALYCSLFGLLLWDQLFAPVPGMFLHPFQTGPLDETSAAFFETRREGITQRLEYLANTDAAQEVARAYPLHAGTSTRFVRWDAYTQDQLVRAATALGPALVPILARIARHPGRHARGMPDLLVFQDGGPLAIEVKGPGDQVRLEQRLWHDSMARAGVDVRIARVRRSKTKE